MNESQFWNPKTETLTRSDLRALQLAKLRIVSEWAASRSPFYAASFKAAGFEPTQLKSFADIERIPFLTRDDWMTSQAEHPPYGELPVAGSDSAVRMHTTSGTSGKQPLRALDTRKDWSWAAEMWCYALWAAGVRPSDIGYVAFGYGSFIGFWGLHNGLEKIGALTIPGGAQTTPNRVKQIVEFGATVVASTPTYALRLAQEAESMGADLRSSAVRLVILSGEPTPESTRHLIEEQWGAIALDTAGMTEISTIFMFEPSDKPGGCHIIEDHFIEQVVDPLTGTELPYGEAGERVTTSFGRGIMPLLRYRTSDLVVKIPHTATSSGRTFDIYQGGIIGRVDDMKLVRGTNVYPRAIEGVVRQHNDVEEFQVEIVREGIRDEIILRVETVESCPPDAWIALERVLQLDLAEAHEGLRFDVQRAEPGTLPRYELKARRLTDSRPGA